MEAIIMKVSLAEKNGLTEECVLLIQRLVGMIPWPSRRVAKADVVETLLGEHLRAGEDVFGWSRESLVIGQEELHSGAVHANAIEVRRKLKTEEKLPNIKQDIHALFDSQSQADSHLRTTFRYLNASAANVRETLIKNGYSEDELPTIRTISNLLNRMKFKLHTVQKAKPQKKRRKRT
jgi:hypothetical protein